MNAEQFHAQHNQNDENQPIKITITIPTHGYFISGIRDFTLEMVKKVTTFSDQWAFRFQSVIDELCNNAIEHGSEPGKDIKITFIAKKNDYLEIYVEDTGTGKEKMTPEQLNMLVKERSQQTPTSLKTMRGRGLPQIVKNWTDVLEFGHSDDMGGTKVHIIKYIKQDATHQQSSQVYGFQLQ